MVTSAESISAWSKRFVDLAEYPGEHVPDVDRRIQEVRSQWAAPLPDDWHRGREDNRWDASRYRRGDDDQPQQGEHWLEDQILVKRFDTVRCFGGRLLDGVNAYPLGQPGKVVEVDLVLLAEVKNQLRILVVEAKWKDKDPWGSNCPWYAVMENLRQLRLFTASPHAPRFFHRRRSLSTDEIPVTGVVLAPSEYFIRKGKQRNSLAPARRLIETMKPHVEVVLAEYEPVAAEIRYLPS